MSYFKTKMPLGALTIQRTGMTTTSVSQQAGVATPQSIALDKAKAEWPRCVINGKLDPNYYQYKFADGRTICTRGWNQEYYAMIAKGQSPVIAGPDLSKVKPGTSEYFSWLCRAQGNPEIQDAFVRAGLDWKPTGDSRMRALNPPYEDRAHPLVAPQYVGACSSYVKNNGGNELSWRNQAFIYSTDVQGKGKEGTRPDGTPGTAEHRASQCESRVPPELVEACKAALAKNDGTSIESFEKQIGSMTPDQLEQLIYGSGSTLPTPPSMGIPPVLLYGGIAAAVGLVAFVALKGKKA